ncbi:hypothetical protein pdam_00023952 [Pocillopora damicornis]|uniref:Uncharacterized protein n=1 Tax=Pocillopora damicornis TaxID=46731 RepID=A0A3M6U7D1_POCDA|nr:hypothetical protein pdam_00023952 [Pocillopora damicornis]
MANILEWANQNKTLGVGGVYANEHKPAEVAAIKELIWQEYLQYLLVKEKNELEDAMAVSDRKYTHCGGRFLMYKD